MTKYRITWTEVTVYSTIVDSDKDFTDANEWDVLDAVAEAHPSDVKILDSEYVEVNDVEIVDD